MVVVTHNRRVEGGSSARKACKLPPGSSAVTVCDGEVLHMNVVAHDRVIKGGSSAMNVCGLPPGCSTATSSGTEVPHVTAFRFLVINKAVV